MAKRECFEPGDLETLLRVVTCAIWYLRTTTVRGWAITPDALSDEEIRDAEELLATMRRHVGREQLRSESTAPSPGQKHEASEAELAALRRVERDNLRLFHDRANPDGPWTVDNGRCFGDGKTLPQAIAAFDEMWGLTRPKEQGHG